MTNFMNSFKERKINYQTYIYLVIIFNKLKMRTCRTHFRFTETNNFNK